MQSRLVRCLSIFAIATSISGCGSVPHPDFEPPPRPLFFEYDELLWQQIPLEAQDAISADDLACKAYIRRVEKRAAIHNNKDEE